MPTSHVDEYYPLKAFEKVYEFLKETMRRTLINFNFTADLNYTKVFAKLFSKSGGLLKQQPFFDIILRRGYSGYRLPRERERPA